jgi:hypothetical protein
MRWVEINQLENEKALILDRDFFIPPGVSSL